MGVKDFRRGDPKVRPSEENSRNTRRKPRRRRIRNYDTGGAIVQIKSPHDHRARLADAIDLRDGFDPQIHNGSFIGEIEPQLNKLEHPDRGDWGCHLIAAIEARECLSEEQSAAKDGARSEVDEAHALEKRQRLEQLEALSDAIRLSVLSDLERKVIEMRFCCGEPDGARALRMFSIRDDVFYPGDYLSADEVDGIATENLLALQAGGYIEPRCTPPSWRPPSARAKAKRGRPPKTGTARPATYDEIAAVLKLYDASAARKVEKRALKKLRRKLSELASGNNRSDC